MPWYKVPIQKKKEKIYQTDCCLSFMSFNYKCGNNQTINLTLSMNLFQIITKDLKLINKNKP
uniref:Uncharacterized protein n=1 Tax=Solanum lycopersicum TaxID=4081 RepID=A0A3Q7GEY0_SOLLC